jgi:hypothetical protein
MLNGIGLLILKIIHILDYHRGKGWNASAHRYKLPALNVLVNTQTQTQTHTWAAITL